MHFQNHKAKDFSNNEGNHTYIFMVHVAKELDFSQCSLGIYYVVKCITNLLYGDLLMCVRIHSSTEQKDIALSNDAMIKYRTCQVNEQQEPFFGSYLSRALDKDFYKHMASGRRAWKPHLPKFLIPSSK